MHVKNDHDVDSKSQFFVNVGSNESDQVIQVLIFFGQLLFHGLGLVVLIDSIEDILDGESPPDL